MPKPIDTAWAFSKPSQKVQWPYNRWYNAHIRKRTRYGYVREHWDRQISELQTLARLKAEKRDPVSVRLSDEDRDVFRRIGKAGVETLMDFLDRVATQDQAAAFCAEARLAPDELVTILRKVYRYLPQGAQMRQLVAKDDPVYPYLGHLTSRRLGHSLALLEVARTREGRTSLAAEAAIPEDDLLDLVLRADLTRLHLMGGGMIRTQWALGYRGLDALQKAEPEDYYAACVAHYELASGGMPFDFTMGNVEAHIARMRDAVSIVEL